MADERPPKANTLRVKIARFIDAEASGPWGILGVVLVIALMAALAYAPVAGSLFGLYR